MSDTYTPPAVWTNDAENGGRFANINSPVSGAREQKDLPRGQHPYQLYSLATPNGVKANLILEELIEAGEALDYDAWIVNIGEGEQFTSGFVDINPNSKIPALLDLSGDTPVRVFESGAILLHMAEKYNRFLSKGAARAEMLSWLFWQVGSAPFIGGGFGHFYAYAPEKWEYPINRYAMETKRLFDVADKRLAETRFLSGDDYTIADMAAWPWFAPFFKGVIYNDAKTFLSVDEYTHVARWAAEIGERPAAKRALIVNKSWGDDEGAKLPNRHSAADFEGKNV